MCQSLCVEMGMAQLHIGTDLSPIMRHSLTGRHFEVTAVFYEEDLVLLEMLVTPSIYPHSLSAKARSFHCFLTLWVKEVERKQSKGCREALSVDLCCHIVEQLQCCSEETWIQLICWLSTGLDKERKWSLSTQMLSCLIDILPQGKRQRKEVIFEVLHV